MRKDGSYFFANGVQTPLFDEHGKPTGYAKIARDLTERFKFQEDFKFQEELKEAKGNLEVQVRERTSKLKESNDSLPREVVERTQLEKLRGSLSRKIVKPQEDERKRIARDIHDHISQGMTGLKLKLELLKAE